MLSVLGAIGLYLIIFLVWLICLVIAKPFQLKSRIGDKKSYKKVKEVYPYFKYPWYKKIFLLGLNGFVPKYKIVFAFIQNIIIITYFVPLLWVCIANNIIPCIIIKILTILFFVSMSIVEWIPEKPSQYYERTKKKKG